MRRAASTALPAVSPTPLLNTASAVDSSLDTSASSSAAESRSCAHGLLLSERWATSGVLLPPASLPAVFCMVVMLHEFQCIAAADADWDHAAVQSGLRW